MNRENDDPLLNNLKQMMRDRRYTEFGRIDVDGAHTDDLNNLCHSSKSHHLSCRREDEKKSLVCWAFILEKLAIKEFRTIHDIMKDRGVRHVIFVTPELPTPYVSNVAKKLQFEDAEWDIEFFSHENIKHPPVKHDLYKPHTAVDPSEYERVSSESHNLPILLPTDPVCRYFHFPIGSIIRIDRKKYHGVSNHQTFRIVKDPNQGDA